MSPRGAVPGDRPALEERVRTGCMDALARLTPADVPVVPLEGQLIRPLLGYLAADAAANDALWAALLAVQYAHEASLLHDDVIDEAARRRGAATLASSRGVAAALVAGDHLLTAGYRFAALTASLPFVALYARAVERTVAGERLQGELRGQLLTRTEYEQVVLGKSGELIGLAFAASPTLRGDARAGEYFEVGRRIGLCYQMVDDLLDYCAGADTGKTAFGDFRQRLWTWPVSLMPGGEWPADARALEQVLHARSDAGDTLLERALAELSARCGEVRRAALALVPRAHAAALDRIFDGWLERARVAVERTLQLAVSNVPPTPASPSLPAGPELRDFFARNSRSFSFAARLFPAAERARIAELYAFCRVTDDLVDSGDAPAAVLSERLDAWEALCRQAYERGDTGVLPLDRLLRRAARDGVPFTYVQELIAGMRMDLRPARYESLAELRTYTHRVASVIGQWLARSWGVRDPLVLQRAADLGHALQLTNIIRDVGEDWRRRRIYLPRDLMHSYGVDESVLQAVARGQAPPPRYRALLEQLMAVADAYYERAFQAMPSLPSFARRPVAVAAEVYRGIHEEVRANDYDNIKRRARTGLARKLWLAWRGVRRLRHVSAPRSVRWAHAAGAAAVLSLLLLAGAARAQEPAALDTLRRHYHAAIASEPALDSAFLVLARLPASEPLPQAYRGALTLLRARHGSWPPTRLRQLRAGLRELDAAVAAAPQDAEVRYLRLVSTMELPGWAGRRDDAGADARVLATLLAADPASESPEERELRERMTRYLAARAYPAEGL